MKPCLKACATSMPRAGRAQANTTGRSFLSMVALMQAAIRTSVFSECLGCSAGICSTPRLSCPNRLGTIPHCIAGIATRLASIAATHDYQPPDLAWHQPHGSGDFLGCFIFCLRCSRATIGCSFYTFQFSTLSSIIYQLNVAKIYKKARIFGPGSIQLAFPTWERATGNKDSYKFLVMPSWICAVSNRAESGAVVNMLRGAR